MLAWLNPFRISLLFLGTALMLTACAQLTSAEPYVPVISDGQTPSVVAVATRPASPVPARKTPLPTPSLLPPLPTVTPAGKPAPELEGGGEWLNSTPLRLADLRGKVVLVQFWTYGCYNCTNTLPYVQSWWQQYKDKGLVIIGVHTPEFDHEHVLANVRAASERLGVVWPVIQDNDYAIWRAYGNNYWPHFYLIDKQGAIIYDHIGEGRYDETERQIQQALATEN